MRVALVAVAAAAYVPDLDGVGTETPYADLVAAMSNATAQRFAAAIAEAAAARYACNVSLASQTAAFENYSDLLASAQRRPSGARRRARPESLLLLDCDFAGYHFYDMVDGALTPTPRVRRGLAALSAVVGRSAHPPRSTC
ncbi:hypothetical protein JL721_13095 [Aureococcus anophagefferens]|nr:hypothetical protein JL721_13095 [Aureococcus anophagefferens]